jgi:hypothetical protein
MLGATKVTLPRGHLPFLFCRRYFVRGHAWGAYYLQFLSTISWLFTRHNWSSARAEDPAVRCELFR